MTAGRLFADIVITGVLLICGMMECSNRNYAMGTLLLLIPAAAWFARWWTG